MSAQAASSALSCGNSAITFDSFEKYDRTLCESFTESDTLLLSITRLAHRALERARRGSDSGASTVILSAELLNLQHNNPSKHHFRRGEGPLQSNFLRSR